MIGVFCCISPGWFGRHLTPKLLSWDFLPLFIFYLFTVFTLDSWDRVLLYLKAWNYMLLGVAVIALASLFNMDLTGAAYHTMVNEGRLCIGTWMHDNPNALGHSMSVVMPLSYMLYFWHGSALQRFVIFPVQSGLACWCIYETQSKGAFLVTGVLMVLVFVIGRGWIVKLFALMVALSLGVSALSFLPRMSEVGNLRADEGVQGRLMAWELAKTAMEQRPAGWKQFMAYISWLGKIERKATHSSYVQVGADLGIQGMAFYLLTLWVAFRTSIEVWRFTRDDESHERCRRAIMLLILAYAISGWMINREYHTEYFLLIAVAAAIHRLQLANDAWGDVREVEEVQNETTVRDKAMSMTLADKPLPLGQVWQPSLAMLAEEGLHSASTPDSRTRLRDHFSTSSGKLLGTALMGQSVLVEESDDSPEPKKLWNRIGLLDLSASALLTWATLYIWEYVLKNL